MFIDETYVEFYEGKGSILSLTRVSVSDHKFDGLRSVSYSLLVWLIKPESGHINLNLPEFNGKEQLFKCTIAYIDHSIKKTRRVVRPVL